MGILGGNSKIAIVAPIVSTLGDFQKVGAACNQNDEQDYWK